MALINSDVVPFTGGAYEIEQSLRFNDNDSAYLSWTPSSDGNLKKWTLSLWAKKSNLDTYLQIFNGYVGDGSSVRDAVSINNVHEIEFVTVNNNSVTSRYKTSRLLRDVSHWYHIVVAVDTAQATASNRVRIYINGEENTSFSSQTTVPQNHEFAGFNNATSHAIGKSHGTNYADGYMSEYYFIDGQQLDPTYFGETGDYGEWKPIEYTGTYGTNGFYLPFKNDYAVEGFSTVTYTGNASTQYIGGTGFSPDLVWIKSRSNPRVHNLFDTIRGATNVLESDQTGAEATQSGSLTAFNTDGFTTGSYDNTNANGNTFVAWCWDMGTGGEELVTNGTFDEDYSGWTASSGATLSLDSNRLKVAQTTSNGVYAYQTLTGLDTSATYVITNTLVDSDSQVFVEETLGALSDTVYYATQSQNTSGGTFTPSATTMYLELRNGTSADNTSSRFDNISIKKLNNTNGSIDAVVKANPTYGQSIVSFTGTGTAGDTIGHGLSSAPEMVIIKKRDAAENWNVYHSGIGAEYGLRLNSNVAKADSSTFYNDTAPTSSVVTLGNNETNTSGNTFIAYCFHSVSGYSSFGSFTGNATVTTGFKPAFVMIKRYDAAENWFIWDTLRNNFDAELYADSSSAEYNANRINVSSTGFETVAMGSEQYIYMAFADKREFAYWLDQSGNNNDWTSNNLTESDISVDSPTNNFATLNFLDKNNSVLSEGNLKVTDDGSSSWNVTRGTIGASSGKWYWEYYVTPVNGVICPSVTTNQAGLSSLPGQSDNYGITYYPNGKLYKESNGSGVSYGATYTNGDIIGVALNMDSGTITYYKNNVSQGVASTNLLTYGNTWFPTTATYYSGSSIIINLGQDSSFAGNKTAQGNTDGNSIGDFYYTPPSGYLALCTANLPDPAVIPSENFNVATYTGDGSSGHSITYDNSSNMQPDFLWFKVRSAADSHALFDSIRGVNKILFSNVSNAESTDTNGNLESFDSNGFTVGGNQYYANNSGASMVSWGWKAGGSSGVSNTNGTITSTVSANQDAGFSIVSYTGTGSSATVGHGLSTAPDMIITKSRDGTDQWIVQAPNHLSTDYGLRLQDSAGQQNDSGNIDDPTNTNIVLPSSWGGNNTSGTKYIAYCFHSVDGFSKVGSYTGNGSSDGTFVYTGFRPAFVLVKYSSGSGGWFLWDSERGTPNPENPTLLANVPNAEQGTTGWELDKLSNGFKLRATAANQNVSGGTYIYLAMAEHPFKYTNAK